MNSSLHKNGGERSYGCVVARRARMKFDFFGMEMTACGYFTVSNKGFNGIYTNDFR